MAKRKGVNSRKQYIQKKHERSRKIRNSAPFALAGLLLAGVVAGVIYSGIITYEKASAAVASSKLFSVRNVTVKGNERVAASLVLEQCGIGPASKIFDVTTAAVSANLENNPWIENVRCIKKLWGAVVIEIRERTPFVLVNNGDVALADRSGMIIPLEKGKEYDLPMISGAEIVTGKHGRRCVDAAVMARVVGFIDSVNIIDRTLFRIMPQLDVKRKDMLRGFAVSPSTVVEIDYDADALQLRNLRYLLENLVARHVVPDRINVQYHNLAYIMTDEHKDDVHAD